MEDDFVFLLLNLSAIVLSAIALVIAFSGKDNNNKN